MHSRVNQFTNPTMPWSPEVESQLISSVATPLHSNKSDYSTYNRFPLIPEVQPQFISSVATPLHSNKSYYSREAYVGYSPHEKFSSISSIAPALLSYKQDHLAHDKISPIVTQDEIVPFNHSDRPRAYIQRYQVQQPKGVSPIAAQDLIYDQPRAYIQRSQVQQPVNQANAADYYQMSRAQPPERSKAASAPHEYFYQQGIEDIIRPKLQYSHRGNQGNQGQV